MVKDAALCVADLEIELTRIGLTLSDADPWNVLFDGCRPVYVDFSNIRPVAWDPDRSWRQLRDQLYNCFVYPLVLMSQGYGHLARLLLTNREYGVIQSEFAALMGYRGPGSETNEAAPSFLSVATRCIPRPINSIAKKGIKLFNAALSRSYSGNYQARRDAVQQLRQELERIPMPEDFATTTTDDENSCLPLAPSDRWTQKHHAAYKVLSDLRPSSVLDIGSGQAWYSQLAASLRSNVVALDMFYFFVARCYREAKSKNLPILPLVMNIRFPSPGYGLCNKEVAPAFQRLQCDMVLALGLVHLLVFKYYVPFEQIVETLATFARRWLLVEFISREDGEVRNLWWDWLSWYTLDQFQAVLGRYFNNITILPSHPQRRILLLCEKSG